MEIQNRIDTKITPEQLETVLNEVLRGMNDSAKPFEIAEFIYHAVFFFQIRTWWVY